MKFEKIELNSESKKEKKKPLLPKLRLKRPAGRKIAVIGGILGLFFILLLIFLVLPIYQIYAQALETQKQAEITYSAVKNQDIKLAKDELAQMQDELKKLEARVDKIGWVGYLPVMGNYQKDLKHGLTAGLAGVEGVQIAVEAIEPYSDLLGLEGGSSFVEKSTEERLETGITTLDKITPKLGDIAAKLEIVKTEIDAIDPNRYPENIRGKEVRTKLVMLKDQIDKLAGLFIDSRSFLEAFPELVGARDPKVYLVLFQNDKELRPTGGFITAYAYFRLDKGKFEVIKSDDIYNMDNARSKKIGAPDEILKYHEQVYYFYLRDSNLSPDFKISMQQFEELYEDVWDKQVIDGIIAVDTHVLVEAMKILGPIPAYGTTFTTEPDDRCGGCPQVVYELEEYADQRVNYARGNRKDIIGVLLLQIMQKALGVSPGQFWGKLFQMGLDEIQEKHILAYFHDSDAQKGAETLNFAGRIKEYDGDYLHINDTNFAGAKSNMFTNHTIVQDIEAGDDGLITKTLTLKYKNTEPGSPGCNLERGGLCLNGLLRNWLRVYVPKGSKLMEFKGSKTEPVIKEDLDRTVFEGFFEVRPEGQAQVQITYQLPFKFEGEKYNILIQKQPGTEGHEYVVNYKGSEVANFRLVTDKEITFEL